MIPDEYGRDFEDMNPPLAIEDVPGEAESLVLIMDDPDAPGKTFTHWVLFNISPTTTNIHEDITPIRMKTGLNDYGEADYGGPKPPNGEHRYYFRLYALNNHLPLPRGASRAEIEGAMKGHVVAMATVMGRYGARVGVAA